MPRQKDVHLNVNGDLEIGANGDIACVYDDDVTLDGIIFRLKTYAGDYELEPNCGASLEDYIGEPNSPELGEKIKDRVFSALTKDGFVSSQAILVDVAPLSASEIVVLINVRGARGRFTLASSLDLLTGKLVVNKV